MIPVDNGHGPLQPTDHGPIRNTQNQTVGALDARLEALKPKHYGISRKLRWHALPFDLRI